MPKAAILVMGEGATATRQVVVQVETPIYFIRLKFISETNQGSCMTNRNPILMSTALEPHVKEVVDLAVNTELEKQPKELKRLKKQKLQNNEYYEMQNVFEGKSRRLFQRLTYTYKLI